MNTTLTYHEVGISSPRVYGRRHFPHFTYHFVIVS